MMVSAETELVVIGAVQVLLASCMGGLRWALTQMLLEKCVPRALRLSAHLLPPLTAPLPHAPRSRPPGRSSA